jgi:hypothetical protein
VSELDFALKQPATEVPGLLNLRIQTLTAKKDQPGVAATAAAYSVLAAKDAGQSYNAACAWSLLYGLASLPGADPGKHAEEYAGKALALLKQKLWPPANKADNEETTGQQVPAQVFTSTCDQAIAKNNTVAPIAIKTSKSKQIVFIASRISWATRAVRRCGLDAAFEAWREYPK